MKCSDISSSFQCHFCLVCCQIWLLSNRNSQKIWTLTYLFVFSNREYKELCWERTALFISRICQCFSQILPHGRATFILPQFIYLGPKDQIRILLVLEAIKGQALKTSNAIFSKPQNLCPLLSHITLYVLKFSFYKVVCLRDS